jgi:SSS family transporter
MKSANVLDYIVVATYFLFMLGIGVYYARASKGGKDFFAGGNMLPWWVSGMSLYMANFSVWIFTGGAGFAYYVGWFALIYFGIGGIGYWVGTALTAVQWRRSRSISPTEYTYTRYNVVTQQLIGWVIVVNFTLSAGVQLASTSKLLAPVLGLDVTLIAVVTGSVILLYSLMGGAWGVVVTDTLQGVILLATAFIVVPASLFLVGGFEKLATALPGMSFDHVYNGVHYDEHWLVAIFLISSTGFAAGGAQRFFSVKNEKDARKVGWLAGALALTGPLVFGIPPLVARVVWPDLSQVEFFKPYAQSNPQDLVYIGLCLQILPNGLIGVFLAAMLSATMSTLSSVYNMVSSILARDMYQGLIRPETTDKQLLTVGRVLSLVIGLIVTGLAVIFVLSQFGIFNLLVTFFTLLNVPVVVPTAFGLIFRRVPRWSASAAIAWGLIAGSTARFVLGWDIGPQVYLSFILTFGVFVTSHWTGRLYQSNRTLLAAISLLLAVCFAWLFAEAAVGEVTVLFRGLAVAAGIVLGTSLYGFAKLFASETDEQRKVIEEFFRKIDTPIDVAKEVFGQGKKQVSTFPLVGGTTMGMGLLMSLIFLTDLPGEERTVLGGIIVLMVVVGGLMWYLGKKSEIRAAGEYSAKSE